MGKFKKEVKILEEDVERGVKTMEKDIGKEVKAIEKDIEIIEEDISLNKIIKYNLVFFIPVFISVFISLSISKRVNNYLSITPRTTFSLLLIPFLTLIFIFIIPYMRKREKIKSFRMMFLGFLIVGLVMTIPSTIKGNISLMMNHLMYIGIYVLLTFLYAPEVLGIYGDIRQWFKHHHQIIIVGVYFSILFFLVSGFAWQYYEIYNDKTIPVQFNIEGPNPTYATFFYYSTITFATVGYGEISPVGPAARLVATTESFVSMVLNVLFIAILLLYVSNLQAIKHHEHREKIERILKRKTRKKK